MCPRWLYRVALFAPPQALFQSATALIVMALVGRGRHLLGPALGARVDSTSSIIAPPNAQHKAVEPHRLVRTQGSGLKVIEQVLRRICQEENQS